MSCEKVEINMHQKYVDIFYNTKKIGWKIKFENKINTVLKIIEVFLTVLIT